MNPLALDKITVRELTHAETAQLAADLGYQAIGLFAYTGDERRPVEPLMQDGRAKRELARILEATGIRIHNLECLILRPETDPNLLKPVLEFGREMGADKATAVIYDTDLDRARDTFAQTARLAGQIGMAVNLEFLPFSPVNSIGEAKRFIDNIGMPNTGIVVDILHLIRTGGSIAELQSIPADLVRYAQICDGPEAVESERIFHEAVNQRMIPGEGAFPLKEFVEALPAGIEIGIEVPLIDLMEQGIDARERAGRVDRGLRAVLADCNLTGSRQ